MNRFRRLGLQRRIMLYVTAGLTGMFAVLALLGLGTIDQATQLVFRERLSTAYTTAGILERDFARVGGDVRETSRQLLGPDGWPASGAARGLLDHFSRTDPFPFFRVSGVWLLDASGSLLDAAGYPQPPAGGSGSTPGSWLVGNVGQRETVLRALGQTPGEFPLAAVVVGLETGSAPRLVEVVHTVSINGAADYVPAAYGRSGQNVQGGSAAIDAERYHLEILDPDGVAVLGIGPDEHPGHPSNHFGAIRDLMAERRAAALLHEPEPGDGFQPHVIAVVPLGSSPFYVVMEQPVDVALALPEQLRQRILLSIGLGFVAALAVAWVTTRHVVKPTEQLTAAADRMAQGDLASPIGVTAQDEVGQLAESLDAMRQRLRAAYDAAERTNRELESRVAERTARLGQVLRNTISAQEEERRRLARELHDETAQTLAALSIALDRARDSLDAASPALEQIVTAKVNAARLLAETRRLILGLRPTVLDDLGLIPAIRWYCESHLAEHGIEVTFEVDQLAPRMPGHIEVALFRIVQEAVNNVVRHAGAGHVQIRLRFQGTAISVSVADDGRGFDVERALGQPGGESESVGLLGMQERVKLLNGRIEIRSAAGRGTLVIVEVPLGEDAA